MLDFDAPVFFAGDDRLDALVPQHSTQGIRVMGPVGEKARARPRLGEKHADAPEIAVVTGGQVVGDRPAEEVGSDVDLGRAPAARDANRLIPALFF